MDLLPGIKNNSTKPLAADEVVGNVYDALELQPVTVSTFSRLVCRLGFRASCGELSKRRSLYIDPKLNPEQALNTKSAPPRPRPYGQQLLVSILNVSSRSPPTLNLRDLTPKGYQDLPTLGWWFCGSPGFRF